MITTEAGATIEAGIMEGENHPGAHQVGPGAEAGTGKGGIPSTAERGSLQERAR